jgi:hypothetical protein
MSIREGNPNALLTSSREEENQVTNTNTKGRYSHLRNRHLYQTCSLSIISVRRGQWVNELRSHT